MTDQQTTDNGTQINTNDNSNLGAPANATASASQSAGTPVPTPTNLTEGYTAPGNAAAAELDQSHAEVQDRANGFGATGEDHSRRPVPTSAGTLHDQTQKLIEACRLEGVDVVELVKEKLHSL